MEDALQHHEGTISIGGRTITNLRLAANIDGLAESEEELASLVEQLDKAASAYGMEISTEKTTIMTNNNEGITTPIKIQDKTREEIKNFKYRGSIVSDEGSKPEIVARIAQTTAAIGKLRTIWRNTTGLAKTILQGTVRGGLRRRGHRKRWEDNIGEWTGLSFAESQRAVEDRDRWLRVQWCPQRRQQDVMG